MNQTVYEKKSIVTRYASQDHLQYPETLILKELMPYLKEYQMLDLGVGAGRTTVHFAPLVKNYIGIDFSTSMISACQKRFSDQLPNTTFDQGDARDLSRFEDHSFDFVLFSYNGIDYVNHMDRLIILKEIYRVLKPSGFFYFSTHNISNFGRMITPSGLKDKLIQSTLSLIMYVINGGFQIQRKKKYSILRDTGEFFRLKTYYIQPDYQQKQLQEIGFENILTYSLYQEKSPKQDSWIYFRAQKPCSIPLK